MRITGSVATRVNVCVESVDARTGEVLARRWKHNLVVAAGLNILRDLIYGDGTTLTHGAVGTDNTAAAAGDVALGSEAFRDVISQRTKGEGGLTLKFVVGSQSANGLTLREAGLFNAASGGSLYARVIPEAVEKTDAILVIYTWGITFEAAA